MTKQLKTTEKHEVAKPQEYNMEGFEGLTGDVEVIMPVAKLMQANSPELDEEDIDFKKGDIIHSLLLEKMPLKFIPIMFFDTKILLSPKDADKKEAMKAKLGLTDDDMEGIILCRAQDGIHADRESDGEHFGICQDCKLFKFDGADKPLCTHTINVLGLFEGQHIPTVIRFSNTSFKAGKKLMSLTRMNEDIKRGKYKLASIQAEGQGNKWNEFTVKPGGYATDEEFAKATQIYKAYANKTIKTTDEEDDETQGDEY